MKSSNFGHLFDLQLVSEEEAAAVLDLSRSTLRDWRWKGRGPAYIRIGRTIRYEVPVLSEYIAAARISPDVHSNEEVL